MSDFENDLIKRRKMDNEGPSSLHNQTSMKEARKIVQSYTWPVLEHFTSARSYRLLFDKQIADALDEAVPDNMVAKSIYQHFMKDKKTMLKFEHMATKYDFSTTTGIKKIISNFGAEEAGLTNDEKFKEMTRLPQETGMDFMERLKSIHAEFYGRNFIGKERRIKKQFIEGFRPTLDKADKEALMLQPTLIELVLATRDRIQSHQSREVFAIEKEDRVQQTFHQRQSYQIGSTDFLDTTDTTLPTAYPTIEEFLKGQTIDGVLVCLKCAKATGHKARQCTENRFCLYCNIESYHTTKNCPSFRK